MERKNYSAGAHITRVEGVGCQKGDFYGNKERVDKRTKNKKRNFPN